MIKNKLILLFSFIILSTVAHANPREVCRDNIIRTLIKTELPELYSFQWEDRNKEFYNITSVGEIPFRYSVENVWINKSFDKALVTTSRYQVLGRGYKDFMVSIKSDITGCNVTKVINISRDQAKYFFTYGF